MAYAAIEEILSRVSPANPPPPSRFPDFAPEDLKAWGYFICVYLDCSSDGEGRPSFMPEYRRETGDARWNMWEDVCEPFRCIYGRNEAAVKGNYFKILLDYIKKLTAKWHDTAKRSGKILGFDITEGNYAGMYGRAMQARNVAWQKIMTYSATLIGVQNAANSKIILPEIAVLYGKVKTAWDSVFGSVATIKITSSYRTPREQDLVPTARKNQETTHATGGAIDVQPNQDFILFAGNKKKFVFWGYLAWLFRVTGKAAFGKKPYTLVEETAGNEVVHVSYTYLLNKSAISEVVTPELVRPYLGELPHEYKWSPNLLKEDLGPNAITNYWKDFDANTFTLDWLESNVGGLDPNGAVSAGWMSGFLTYLSNHGIEKEKVSRVQINMLDLQSGEP